MAPLLRTPTDNPGRPGPAVRAPRCTDRCPGASNLGLLVYAAILYPCINQLVIVCVEIFAQKECYIDDAANILVLITAIY